MKKVLRCIISVISWIVLVLALIMTVLAFSVDKSSGIPNVFGLIPLTVESDSMSPTFSKNDLIVDNEIDDITALKEGDVITFHTLINGNRAINTHRIIEVHNANGNISFTTKGDNNGFKDSLEVYPADIIGRWSGIKIPVLGGAIGYLRTQQGFFICVIIPLVIFFLFELYKFITVIVEMKRPKIDLDEEEIKRRAIEEYLSQQKAAESEKTDINPDKNNENNEENNENE